MITRATRRFFGRLGPGLITGAADDDPSGIATYSQAGAQFGVGMVWSVFLTTPLMVGIQVVSARIGRVTGHGIARNLRDYYPRPLLWSVVSLLAIANTINIAADIGAMGEALRLVAGGSPIAYAFAFGVVAVLFQLFVPYQRLAPVLKWLTLSLFAYVGVVLIVHIPWKELVIATLVPPVELTRDYLLLLVGVLGTTISPYLFFWQASQEVEELGASGSEEPLREHPTHARSHLRRIKIDTWFGMAFSIRSRSSAIPGLKRLLRASRFASAMPKRKLFMPSTATANIPRPWVWSCFCVRRRKKLPSSMLQSMRTTRCKARRQAWDLA